MSEGLVPYVELATLAVPTTAGVPLPELARLREPRGWTDEPAEPELDDDEPQLRLCMRVELWRGGDVDEQFAQSAAILASTYERVGAALGIVTSRPRPSCGDWFAWGYGERVGG